MTKGQFLKALRSSLGILSQEQMDDVIADYEEYFRDGTARGRSEEEIAEGLGDPSKIAKELLCEMRLQAWQRKKSVGNLGRFILALTALGSLNLFLAIPTLVVMCLLTASYAVSVALLLLGLAACISYLPGHDVVYFGHASDEPMHITDSHDGRTLEISKDKGHGLDIHVEDADGTKDLHVDGVDEKSGLHIDLDELDGLGVEQARALSAIGGLICGALLLAFNLWLTRLLVRGFVKYARLNYSILRGE